MNIWKALLRVPPVLGLVVFVAGCVIPSKTIIESNITDDRLSFLVKAQTSKSEVRENLGEPEATFAGRSNWIYTMHIYQKRWGCVLLLCEPWYVSKEKMKVLKIDFDDHGVVSDWSKSLAVVGECTKRDICGTEGGYIVYASSDADAEAKKFAGVGGVCTVYLFTQTGFFPTFVKINDVLGLVVRGNNTFNRWTLPEATYVSFIYSLSQTRVEAGRITFHGAGQASTIDLECVAEDIVFLEIGKDQQGGQKITLAAEDHGRSAVMERRLVLREDIRISY